MKFLGHCKRKGAEPYHLFTVLGEHFIFDTTGFRFYRIDEITSDFLALCLNNSSLDDTKKQMLRLDKYHIADIDTVTREINLLARHGLFEYPNNYIQSTSKRVAQEKLRIQNNLHELQLSLTDKCNLACKYCYCAVTRDTPQKGLMSKKIARQAVDFLLSQSSSSFRLTFFGGEPLLNKSVIDDTIQYAENQRCIYSKKISYIMTTNATLLDDKMIDYIVNYNFGLMVSLDGPREIHDNQCPTQTGHGSYEIAAQNIKKIMERRTVSVRATLAHPLPNLPSLVKFFKDFGFYNIVIGTASNRPEAPSEVDLTVNDMLELTNQGEQLLPEIVETLKQKKKPSYFFYEHWYNQIKDGALIHFNDHIFNCGAGHSVIGVDPEGVFYPCSKFTGMKAWQIGSLSDGLDYEKITGIWLNFQRTIKAKCGKCWAFPACNGPCLWEMACNNGSMKFNNRYCHYMKRNIERSAYISWKSQVDADQLEQNQTTKENERGCTA